MLHFFQQQVVQLLYLQTINIQIKIFLVNSYYTTTKRYRS